MRRHQCKDKCKPNTRIIILTLNFQNLTLIAVHILTYVDHKVYKANVAKKGVVDFKVLLVDRGVMVTRANVGFKEIKETKDLVDLAASQDIVDSKATMENVDQLDFKET